MTIDKSLKIKAGSTKQRNVLKRAERVARLAASDRFKPGDPVLGMPKVRVEKIALKKKKKEKKEEADAAASAAPAAAPNTPATKAPAKK